MLKKQNAFDMPDYGPEPFVVNLDHAARQNPHFRTTLWTGENLQLTLMCIQDEIGLECHDDLDQFLRIEDGCGMIMMGKNEDALNYRARVGKDYAIFIPAGTWHNLINCGSTPLKISSIYAPPHHSKATYHSTRKDAESAEAEHTAHPQQTPITECGDEQA